MSFLSSVYMHVCMMTQTDRKANASESDICIGTANGHAPRTLDYHWHRDGQTGLYYDRDLCCLEAVSVVANVLYGTASVANTEALSPDLIGLHSSTSSMPMYCYDPRLQP